MCGIAGVWQKSTVISEEKFKEALSLLKHRGPDSAGILKIGNMMMGTQRLKIISPEEGEQPVSDGDGNALVFNGAVYNYPELAKQENWSTKSDTEVLFQSLIQQQERVINHLRGMFAFAFYNKKQDRLLLARDRIGQKPLYYFKGDGLFLFASELKSLARLMRAASVEPELNEEAIYHYLCLSNIPEPETIYKHVYALKPAHYLIFHSCEFSEIPYWQFRYEPKWHLKDKEVFETTKELISNATQLRLRADVPVGLFLSGGWDSSVIAYEAAKLRSDIKTFTVEYPFETSQNEAGIAKKTAAALGLSHEIIPLTLEPLKMLQEVVKTFDQPFADSSAIPNLAIAKAVSNEVKVMLNGDGGDEQFGGYRRYFLANHFSKFSLTKYLYPILPPSERRTKLAFAKRMAGIYRLPAEEQYLGFTVDMWRDSLMEPIWKDKKLIENKTSALIAEKKLPSLSKLDQLMHWDRNFNLLSGILVKMDRASMAFSVEARSPFLDHELFEFTSRLPDHFKVKGFKRKMLLKNIYRDKLPDEVVNGKKVSFEAPVYEWISKYFQILIKDLLLNPQAKIYHYLKPAEVEKLIVGQKYQELNVAYLLYSLLILELWLVENSSL
ncbi:asparagine synthetase [glutamine-hydrolyzing] 1 [Marivirga lumbricoides]|uniref:asparagine synthase (glutamine-hydrolyzing) n=1 Tax=Marivirga lumbricoides TaxID=1046115 RepID=A0ABQ1MWJ4_9BACT|nr:asparagine synthetase [glutamine-hydrolyzing] 1 [Marivirga lumbricoides]